MVSGIAPKTVFSEKWISGGRDNGTCSKRHFSSACGRTDLGRPMSRVHRAGLAILIAAATSLLPFAFDGLIFLCLPGALLLLVLGRNLPLTPLSERAACNFLVWLPAVYFFPNLWQWGQSHPNRPTPSAAKVLFIVWLVLLLPWFLFAGLSGMAFDAGPSAEAYTFVWSVWTYPVTLGIAAVLRRWVPWIVLLPFLNMAACIAPGLLHK
jgi:hypothetical protein